MIEFIPPGELYKLLPLINAGISHDSVELESAAQELAEAYFNMHAKGDKQ